MVIHFASSGAQLGSFKPFEVGDEEVVLTGLWLDNLEPSHRIVLEIEIGWDKPITSDLGELEIMIRKGDPNGEIVEWTQENCFNSTLTKIEVSTGEESSFQNYVLTVKSLGTRARIIGPYLLKGSVLTK
ncbi:hypothetical protein [Cohnella phaseoli]|uniref:Uncharacterized protein n=1 Tax=Cohnella phaseoli TaxID=456490 RepID=A0A3D9JRX5_9BACL|nr:hypothetical protein [Cohnella phaseoli]RED76853.1 hypothetical protein DFP98_11072 [Cohnella phaseoli]